MIPDARVSPSEDGRSVRKTVPLAGVLREERVRCGKSTCRCARGHLHGPYLYLRWREGRRQRRRYVRAQDAEEVRAATDEWRRLHPPAGSTRDLLADLRRLSDQPFTQEV